jgi:hypothetical protein
MIANSAEHKSKTKRDIFVSPGIFPIGMETPSDDIETYESQRNSVSTWDLIEIVPKGLLSVSCMHF